MTDIGSYFKDYLKRYTPYKNGRWCYEDGCVLIGTIDLYKAGGDSAYRDFVLSFLEKQVLPDGSIPGFEGGLYSIDSFNAGRALYFALDETGDERYRKAIDLHMTWLEKHPRCAEGNFWHKQTYPNQVWLDGLYMAQPFYAEYAVRYGTQAQKDDILRQFRFVRAHLYSADKGLYYHGCDTSFVQPWCDKTTGCSKNFWLRSMGWYVMALADCIDAFGGNDELSALLNEALDGLMPYQDPESGLWYQVIDHPEAEGNYLESSGTAMVCYALMKAQRLGIRESAAAGKRSLEQLIALKLKPDAEGVVRLTDICAVAGLGPGEKRDGSVAYYLSEPKKDDDAKGVGPFMMACAEGMRC